MHNGKQSSKQKLLKVRLLSGNAAAAVRASAASDSAAEIVQVLEYAGRHVSVRVRDFSDFKVTCGHRCLGLPVGRHSSVSERSCKGDGSRCNDG